MAATIVQIADEVVDLLKPKVEENKGTIARSWLVREQLEDSQTLKVDVVPIEDDRSRETRSQWQENYVVEVAVRQRITKQADGSLQQADLDAKAELVETLARLIEDTPVLEVSGAVCVGVSIEVLSDPDVIDELRQFISVIRAEYRTKRTSS